jgi:hypothetical protein
MTSPAIILDFRLRISDCGFRGARCGFLIPISQNPLLLSPQRSILAAQCRPLTPRAMPYAFGPLRYAFLKSIRNLHSEIRNSIFPTSAFRLPNSLSVLSPYRRAPCTLRHAPCIFFPLPFYPLTFPTSQLPSFSTSVFILPTLTRLSFSKAAFRLPTSVLSSHLPNFSTSQLLSFHPFRNPHSKIRNSIIPPTELC